MTIPNPKPSSCLNCRGYSWYGGRGFMPSPEGTGSNNVLLVGEALGEEEAKVGKPFVGRAGLALTQMFQRVGLKREDFLIDNCCRCRPPDNKLSGEDYEQDVLASCAPFLDSTIETFRPKAIVALGATAYHRLVGGIQVPLTDARGFVFFSEKYQTWIIPTFHPAYIMRGNQRLTGVFLHDIKHAVDIAADGYAYHSPTYLLDPLPSEAQEWAFEAVREGRPISVDIETPRSARGIDKSDLLDEEDPTFTILRIGFSWREGDALTIPWRPDYYPAIRALLESPSIKYLWNAPFDIPRLEANGFPVSGQVWDIMVAWHVLNSDLEKTLDFVSTFYAKDQSMWKHLSQLEPAYYNAVDAEVTVRIAEGVVRDLRQNNLWRVFDRHVLQYDEALSSMSRVGVLLDNDLRKEASADLQTKLETLQKGMEEAVPLEARKLKVYKGKPPVTDGMVPLEGVKKVRICSVCGKRNINPNHPCVREGIGRIDIVEEPCQWWGKPEPFKPSNTQLQSYQTVKAHKPVKKVTKRGEPAKITFDDDALSTLIKRYPKDTLYPLVAEYRVVEKIAGTYVGRWVGDRWDGGLPVGMDGKVHTTYTHNPSTLRLSSRNPNLQNIPRPGDEDDPYTIVKTLFVAEPGNLLLEADFSAIEAVLVGYFAGSKDYIRLAKLGVHDYLNSHILVRHKLIDHPADLNWSDTDLKAFFADLKKRFGHYRDIAKKTVHRSNYGGTPKGMSETDPDIFPTIKDAAVVQSLYFEVCPAVKAYQIATINQAERSGYLRNPYGYIHRFWRVLQWKKVDGKWASSWGEDAKAALAFLPQSTAAGIIAEAILRLYQETEAAPFLRLQIHDSIVASIPEGRLEEIATIIVQEMERPVAALPLDPKLGLGSHLSIGVEAKVGLRWGKGMRLWLPS